MSTYKISFPMQDGQQRPTSKTLNYAGTPANENTDSQAYLVALATVSDIGVIKTIATQQNTYIATADKITPDPQANRDEGVTLSVTCTDGSGASLTIPAPQRDAGGLFTYVTNGVVDIANAQVLAYVGQFAQAGFNGQVADGPFRLSGGRLVATLDSGSLD